MQQEEMNYAAQAIEQWMEAAENKWKEAKAVLEDRIENEKLNQWETTLHSLQSRIGHLKNSRLYDENDSFTSELSQINQECKELYDKYERFSDEMNQTPSLQNEAATKQEETEEDRLEFKKTKNKWMPPKDSVPPGKHKLPPLPYSYDALEPTIDEEIMRLHHDKHHQSYVDGLNKAETKMKEARQKGNFDLIRHWEREAAFNGAGHYLHTIFWNVMSPNGGGKPQGALLEQIKHDFGNYNAFKNHFTEAAKNVEGPGWAILVWSPRSHRLVSLQAEKHQLLSQWDVVPLLVLDVWEHAYYLQYKTDKDKYVDNWWNVVNWDHVTKRFNEAEKLRWKPY